MKMRIAALIAVVLGTVGTLSAAPYSTQFKQLAQASSPEDGGPDVAAARALLDSWKGEIEVLEQARHKLEAAWKVDPKTAAALQLFERYQVVRKQMYEIQRKTRGGPGVAEARKILDSWSGQPEVLARAKEALDKVVASDAYNAYVPIEAARLQIMRGYINSRYVKNGKFVYTVGNYAPQTLMQALQTLRNATRFDPLNADAFVMQAYIYKEQTRLDTAEALLKQAESMGSNDPRRHLNWADVYIGRGNYPAAVERVQRALQEGSGDTNMTMGAQTRLAEIYKNTGEAEKAIAAHEAMLKLEPGNAWLHNNYSAYLSGWLGRNDKAIDEARTALKIMDFGMGRHVLATALYGKWADLVAERKAGADAYFEEAKKLRPGLDEMMAFGASLPTGERLAKALISKGVSIDARAPDGSTALLIATNVNRNQTVKYLLNLKANPNLADANGWTPLLSAASEGNSGNVDLLLANGADSRATLNGKDAATLAEQNGYPELAASLRRGVAGKK